MTPLPALVFDLDGTLIDSIPQVAAAVNATLAEASRPPLPLPAIRTMIGEGAKATVERAFAATGGIDGIDLGARLARYLVHYLADPASHTVVYPGVFDVLEQLSAAGARMGICTNKPGATTRPVLDALGLSRYFTAVVTADDTRHPKPDGRHVLETILAMNAELGLAVFVGDSKHDLAAARDARVPAVAVTYGYGYSRDEAMTAAACIDRFQDLPAAIAKILDQIKGTT